MQMANSATVCGKFFVVYVKSGVHDIDRLASPKFWIEQIIVEGRVPLLGDDSKVIVTVPPLLQMQVEVRRSFLRRMKQRDCTECFCFNDDPGLDISYKGLSGDLVCL